MYFTIIFQAEQNCFPFFPASILYLPTLSLSLYIPFFYKVLFKLSVFSAVSLLNLKTRTETIAKVKQMNSCVLLTLALLQLCSGFHTPHRR